MRFWFRTPPGTLVYCDMDMEIWFFKHETVMVNSRDPKTYGLPVGNWQTVIGSVTQSG